MSEFRQDRTTGEWVIIAPEREQRPREHLSQREADGPVSALDHSCPFCPGNEAQLPGIIAEKESSEPPGWQLRVVPNKYPAVRLDASSSGGILLPNHVLAGVGSHELVIESPLHNASLTSMSIAEIEVIVTAYRHRFAALLDQTCIEAVILFRNQGVASGASLAHPHSQLIALSLVPPWVRSKARWARQHYHDHSVCLICEDVERESLDGKRVIGRTPWFMAMVPFAATVPFEVLLVPTRHQSSFTEIDDNEVADLARLLQGTLRSLDLVRDSPPYRLVIESATKPEVTSPHTHWRLRIAPDLVKWGGFELGTRMPINSTYPEENAALLRQALTHAQTVV
jgi:UDPglucose--hexose-1-phosphate uridylyltransferase